MASYRFAVGAQAPLQVQLTTFSGNAASAARIREVAAFGENLIGTASDPILLRPSTLGIGINNFVDSLEPGGKLSSAAVVYSFSSSPSHPTPTGMARVSGPVSRRFVFPRGSEFIVREGAAALLYATSAGGHTYTGEFCWEEL